MPLLRWSVSVGLSVLVLSACSLAASALFRALWQIIGNRLRLRQMAFLCVESRKGNERRMSEQKRRGVRAGSSLRTSLLFSALSSVCLSAVVVPPSANPVIRPRQRERENDRASRLQREDVCLQREPNSWGAGEWEPSSASSRWKERSRTCACPYADSPPETVSLHNQSSSPLVPLLRLCQERENVVDRGPHGGRAREYSLSRF